MYVSDIQVNHANLARDKDMQHNKKLDKVILMLRLKLFPIADLKHRLKLLPSVELGLSRKQSLKNQQIIKANPSHRAAVYIPRDQELRELFTATNPRVGVRIGNRTLLPESNSQGLVRVFRCERC